MSNVIDRLAQRFMVEQSWNIVTDADDVSVLPNEEALLTQLEAETDPDVSDELLFRYFEAQVRHKNAAPLIGGPLPDMADIAEVEGDITLVTVTAPSIRALKPYCARIVMKFTGLAISIKLLIDGPIPRGLTRKRLFHAGNAFREDLDKAIAADEEAMAAEADSTAEQKPKSKLKTKPKKLQPIAINFELIQVGWQIDSSAARADLLQLRCSFNRKDRVFISGYLLDTATKRVWTTQGITGFRRRRNLRYALIRSDQRPAEIREAIHSIAYSWKLVLAAVLVALLATGLSYFVQLTGDPHPLAMLLGDITIPVAIILGAVSQNRLHYHSARQTKHFLIGYFSVYIGVISWLAWPLSIELVMYMAKVTFFASFTSMLASTMMELE